MTAVMSTSLNVVSIAAVLCASTSRLAIVARRFDMRTRSSVRSSSERLRSSPTGGTGFAFAVGAAAGAASAGGAAGPAAAGFSAAPDAFSAAPDAFSTSLFITRPPSPLPRRLARSTSFAAAAFFAVGVARGVLAASLAASTFGASASPGDGVAAPFAESSRIPSTSPTFTSSPSLRSMRLSTPACGALTSTSILSVSSSTSGSPAATASPSLRSHLATRASTMDSPTSGTTMLDGISVGQRG